MASATIGACQHCVRGGCGCSVTTLPLKEWKRAMHSWGRDEQGGKFVFNLT